MSDATVTAFVGDSLTERGDWQALLPGETVVNLGVGGNTTTDLLGRIDEVVAVRPAAVVLEIGTNDFAWRLPVEQVVENIETILTTLRERLPDAHVLVQSILPRQAEYAHVVRGVNEQLSRFAPTVSCRYLDLWPVLAGEDGGLKSEYTVDGLHLTAAGYAAWSAALKPVIETLAQTPAADA
ncbi:MAG TPA: GDSL-type esterase/lipase family protein [Gryllotalpicola sp.]